MNNVQAQQFAALQKATAAYQNDSKMADHMRRREGELMVRATEQQRQLEEQLRVAHGEVGEETRKQKNLEVERKRYKQAIEADRQAIVKITSELKGIEANEKEQKIQFVKEMESINDENDQILTQRENRKMLELLDAENVSWLCETKLSAKMNGGKDGVGELQEAEENERWNEVAAQVKDELARLVEIEEKDAADMKEQGELEQLLLQLRSKFMSVNNNVGEMEIGDLEAKWEQQYEYNQYDEEDGGEGEHAMDADGGEAANNTSGSSPVHMELFYGNQEYDGPVHDTNAVNNVGQAC